MDIKVFLNWEGQGGGQQGQEATGHNIASLPCSCFCCYFRCLCLLHLIFVVQLLALASLNCHLVSHFQLELDALVARLLLGGISPA